MRLGVIKDDENGIILRLFDKLTAQDERVIVSLSSHDGRIGGFSSEVFAKRYIASDARQGIPPSIVD